MQVGVGTHGGGTFSNWQLARDDEAVVFARRVVDAAVAGRVQVGHGPVDYGGRLGAVRTGHCRVALLDGTVVVDPRLDAGRPSLFRQIAPVEWTSWSAPYA